MKYKAVVLAGGKGTRLQPYTITLPKPLVPIDGKPILEIILKKLAEVGFGYVTICVNHMSEIIEAYFNNSKNWGLEIDFSLEEIPLSTMGPLKLVKHLPENFLVMNGDVLTDLNFGDFLHYHSSRKNLFTIAAFNRQEVIDYGVMEVNNDGCLTNFNEKPCVDFLVSMGVYAVNKKILDYIPNNTYFGFDDLMRKLLYLGILPNIYRYEGFWLDIGRPNDYQMAVNLYEKK